jgi:hypothetical protein
MTTIEAAMLDEEGGTNATCLASTRWEIASIMEQYPPIYNMVSPEQESRGQIIPTPPSTKHEGVVEVSR